MRIGTPSIFIVSHKHTPTDYRQLVAICAFNLISMPVFSVGFLPKQNLSFLAASVWNKLFDV
jgi:hypothetical protein